MNCSFSGLPVPTDKLFVLYYPPAAAHETWDRSFFAAARAREALAAIVDELEHFFRRYVITGKLAAGIAACLLGIALGAYWGISAWSDWDAMGSASRYGLPLLALASLLFGRSRVRAFLHRWKVWRDECRETVDNELAAMRRVMEGIPTDPDAEEAAAIMRRECPDMVSAIAFYGTNFNAFTYMDFILSPKLKHPSERKDLPAQHSPYRDAYYVGDVVYDNWRMFNQDHRTLADPRFVGSRGRRGVI